MPDWFKKLAVACLAINLILGFIAFGYIVFQFVGGFSIILTMVFLFLVIIGYSSNKEEIEENVLKQKRHSQ
ncbi:hypothetical protein BN871_GR_00120 [Paenibacillus sp. P22]|nr:hypothetical protein BN871_GR_00120 [Paenibacillus sp. P22]